MKITVVGKSHAKGTSKKTGKPYDFVELHYLGKDRNVDGQAAKRLTLDPTQIPYNDIRIGADYIVEFDDRGRCVDIAPADQDLDID